MTCSACHDAPAQFWESQKAYLCLECYARRSVAEGARNGLTHPDPKRREWAQEQLR